MILSKKNIAIRHMNQAIKMFFRQEDPISIHLLVCATNEILHALLKKEQKIVLFGKNGKIIDSYVKEEYIKNEYFKNFNKKRVEAYNFFKHADKDANKNYNFNSNLNWYFIFENLIMIKQLNMHYSKEMVYFYFWLVFTKRKLFIKNTFLDEYIQNFDFKEDDYFVFFEDVINQIKYDTIKQIEKNIETNIKELYTS